MGLFGPSIGDEKRQNGERYGYGWCYSCVGSGYQTVRSREEGRSRPRFEINKPRKMCHVCNGDGKLWIGPLELGSSLEDIYIDSGFATIRYMVFKKQSIKESAFYTTLKSNQDTSNVCTGGSWETRTPLHQDGFSFRYCRKCGKREDIHS